MCCSSQSSLGVKLARMFLPVGLVLTNFSLFAQRAATETASPATVPASPEGLGTTIFWVGAVLFACVAAAGGIILARKLHQQKALIAVGAVSAPESARPFALPNGNGNGNGNGSRRLKLNGRPAKAKSSNNANGNSRRRRTFNYQKFYTEMMLQGPSPTSMNESAYPSGAYDYNGYYVEYEMPRIKNNGNGHVNGNGHGSANGNGSINGNGSSANGVEHDASEPTAESNGTLEARASLIATQKSLIEKQQHLIEEQTRLIEEKSRLIAEKNQLLDRQSQMLDNNLL